MGESALLDVLYGRGPSRRPIWFMRQAGRYLPEYKELRAKAGSFLELCYDPVFAAEVTVQPLRRFDLDAAILFADILVVPHAMGLGLRFAEGEGPILETVTDSSGVRSLKEVARSDQVVAVCGTVMKVRDQLPKSVALIGFCGGPWTVASYIVEGGSSDRNRARLAAYNQLPWFDALIEKLIEQSVVYLGAQIEAGAQAVQIFDSWAGELCGVARERYVVRPLRKMMGELRQRYPSVPVIVFARGLGMDHGRIAELGGVSAVGVEAETSLRLLADVVPEGVALQGNLDPVALLADDDGLLREVEVVVRSVAKRRHIFNLGHGIRQETDLRKVAAVVDAVRKFDESRAGDG